MTNKGMRINSLVELGESNVNAEGIGARNSHAKMSGICFSLLKKIPAIPANNNSASIK